GDWHASSLSLRQAFFAHWQSKKLQTGDGSRARCKGARGRPGGTVVHGNHTMRFKSHGVVDLARPILPVAVDPERWVLLFVSPARLLLLPLLQPVLLESAWSLPPRRVQE